MINIVNEHEFNIDYDLINNYIDYLKSSLNNNKDFSLVFINDSEMIDLNSEFRDKDSTTDVLTFCEDDEQYLGDVIVNYDIIEKQANEYNHDFKREMFFLITHGYLHLNGYDHMNEIEEKEMFKLQEELLTNYDIRR